MSDLPGILILKVVGTGAWDLFHSESGGHRWQRVPPTERRGRTQTSTFTVAVFADEGHNTVFSLSDVRFQTTKGTGPGGQHRNKTESAVRATHVPSGLVAFCQNGRSQHQNKAEAIRLLRAKIIAAANTAADSSLRQDRQQQIGSGQRGDKIRTVQVQHDQVTNHLNNRKLSLKAYRKGEIWRLQ